MANALLTYFGFQIIFLYNYTQLDIKQICCWSSVFPWCVDVPHISHSGIMSLFVGVWLCSSLPVAKCLLVTILSALLLWQRLLVLAWCRFCHLCCRSVLTWVAGSLSSSASPLCRQLILAGPALLVITDLCGFILWICWKSADLLKVLSQLASAWSSLSSMSSMMVDLVWVSSLFIRLCCQKIFFLKTVASPFSSLDCAPAHPMMENVEIGR